MKAKFKSTIIKLVILGMTLCLLPAIAMANEPAPKAVVEIDSYDFGTVLEGNNVMHEFVIKNEGDAPLDITNVRTGWGCATVSFERQIPAGGEGTIKIKVSTKNYGGRTIDKTAKVITNDPENERFELKISGHVEKFVTIDPQRVFLTGSVGEKIEKTVKIIPETKPFKILKVIAMKGSFFTHELKEIEVDGKPAYELTIANTRQEAGRYFDQVTVLTDIGDQAPLSIVVSGDIKEKEKDAQ